MTPSTLFVAGTLGLALIVSCGASSLTVDAGPRSGGGGSGGMGGNSGAGCQAMHYYSPGCNASPTCDDGTGGACFTLACGCNGKVLVGCGDYSEPFAYTIPVSSVDASDPAALSCDPDAGSYVGSRRDAAAQGAPYACAGFMVTADGAEIPAPDAGTPATCSVGQTYCGLSLPHPDSAGEATAQCRPVPAVCAQDPSCACLCDSSRGGLFCLTNCGCSEANGFATIFCQGI
jgi:hypothetical protein